METGPSLSTHTRRAGPDFRRCFHVLSTQERFFFELTKCKQAILKIAWLTMVDSCTAKDDVMFIYIYIMMFHIFCKYIHTTRNYRDFNGRSWSEAVEAQFGSCLSLAVVL